MIDSASKLANFLAQHRRPYNLSQLSNLLDMPIKDLIPLHTAAMAAGTARELTSGIFIATSAHALPTPREWAHNPQTASRILDALASGQYESSRVIGRLVNLSHALVCLYLTALLACKAIAVTPTGYQVISRDISRLGANIVPRALATARQQAGLKAGNRVRQ